VNRYLIPLAVFAALIGFLFAGLGLNPREVPSPLIGKPAPAFRLAQLHAPEKQFTREEMLGQVWLLNIWASWCASCRDEHPLLTDLARTKAVPIVGLNYKDKPDEAKAWLRRFGDPYLLSVADPDGRIGIEYGVYGVPETFVIDKTGAIRQKHIGPVTRDSLEKKILPLVRELQKS
jgi:cytochrome c biogenesis protein CcmG, thiol:disulfide interchange protein DsbE